MARGGEAQEQVVNYLILRRAIGILGVVFPVWLLGWCFAFGDCSELQSSISAYYHTVSRDWFVGILFAIGIFLWSYRGPNGEDAAIANLAGGCALGVALFPTASELAWIRAAHVASALGLFLVLAWFSLLIFTKSGGDPTPQKLVRNRIFRSCGYTILLCILLIGLYEAFGRGTGLDALKPVFWLEAFALWAFGFSWMTKGELLVPDPETSTAA